MSSPTVDGVEFRCIPNHPGYAAGSDGAIWSCWMATGRPLYQRVMSSDWTRLRGEPRKEDRRLRYTLKSADGTYRRKYGSHFILEAFVGPRPDGMEACHGDGDCTNDSSSNLRWDTPAGNKADMRRHGTQVAGENHPKTKLTNANIAEIVSRRSRGDTLVVLARDFNVTQARISQIAIKGGR